MKYCKDCRNRFATLSSTAPAPICRLGAARSGPGSWRTCTTSSCAS